MEGSIRLRVPFGGRVVGSFFQARSGRLARGGGLSLEVSFWRARVARLHLESLFGRARLVLEGSLLRARSGGVVFEGLFWKAGLGGLVLEGSL